MSGAEGAGAAPPGGRGGSEADPAPLDVAWVRTEIESIDRELVRLLAARRVLGLAAGAGKRASGHPLMDPAREAQVVARAAAAARALEVPEEGIRQIFWAVVHYCRTAQQEEGERPDPSLRKPPGARAVSSPPAPPEGLPRLPPLEGRGGSPPAPG